MEKKNAICKCNLSMTIKLLIENEIDGDELYNKFTNIEKLTNFFVVKCYELFFSKKGFKYNIGSYILLSILFINIILLLLYLCRQDDQKLILDKYVNHLCGHKQRQKQKNEKQKNKQNKKKTNKNIIKNYAININIIGDKKSMKKKIKNENKNTLVTSSNPPKSKKKIIDKKNRCINLFENNNIQTSFDTSNNKFCINNKGNNIQLSINNKGINKQLNDYEMNYLLYVEAFNLDKRTYCQYYCSLLRRKQILIFTFYISDDYNSKITKISLFLFNFSLYFTVNALFFTDSTMHKIKEDQGIYDFVFQLPQILYSSLICTIINTIVTHLSLNEKEILEIKKEKNNRKEKALKVLKRIRIKLFLYYLINFLLLILFCYYIGCFFCSI